MRSMPPAGSLRRALALLGLAGGAAALAACLSDIGPETCSRTQAANPVSTYTEGVVVNGVYMTSAWDGQWLQFDRGRHIRLMHGLGATPTTWNAYLSFNEYGIRPSKDEEEAP